MYNYGTSIIVIIQKTVLKNMKAKTHKATAKRFKIKSSKKGTKVIKRTNGQDHFNSRESGKTRRNKRSDTTMAGAMRKTITRAIKNF